MPKNGFSKEAALDTALISLLGYLTVRIFLLGDVYSPDDFKQYYFNQYWILSVLGGNAVLYALCYANKWSGLKVLDIFTPPTMLFLGTLFLVQAAFFQSTFFLVLGILSIIYSRILLKTFNTGFTSLFNIISFQKSDEYSFIGGTYLLGIVPMFLTGIAGLILLNSYQNSYWYLALLLILCLYSIFTLYKRSKLFNIKWTIKNLSKNKNKNLLEKKTVSQKKLID
jgi:hypothetical protein